MLNISRKKLRVMVQVHINIEFVQKQMDKALADIEILKDKVRANGSHK